MIARTVSHYRVESEIGSGGMGVVYRAEDLKLGRAVALKFISADLAHDEHAVRRLRAEARSASALNHPNICTIYDIDEHDGHPFIVMELMKGVSLRDRLASGPLKTHQLVDIGIECADALHGAHQAGIVHRDIKPANIFLTESGHVKLLDFGIAKLSEVATADTTTGGDRHSTAAGMAVGTVSYMSPEQVTGEQLDARTDLFSLGVVLYECATGKHPFPGKTSGAIAAAIINQPPVAPVTLNPDLPLRLQEVINNCLEKDRELRYQSAADLRADLRRLRRDLESGQSHVGGLRTAASSTASRESGSGSSSAVFGGERRRMPALALSLAAIAIVALGVAGFYALRDRDAAPAATPPAAAAQPPVLSEAIDARLKLAQASLQNRDFRAALTYAGEVLTLDPGHAEAARIRDAARAALPAVAPEAKSPDIAAPPAPRTRAADPAPSDRRAPPPAEAGPVSRSSPTQSAPQPERPSAPAAPLPDPSPAAAPPVSSPQTAIPAPPDVAPDRPAPKPATTPEPAEKPAAPPPVEEDAAIRNVVTTYARAIETKDLALFRSIKPNLSVEEERRLSEGFRAVTSQKVALTVLSINRRGDEAVVVVRRRDAIDAGGRQRTVESQQMLTLNRARDAWVISTIK